MDKFLFWDSVQNFKRQHNNTMETSRQTYVGFSFLTPTIWMANPNVIKKFG